MNVNYMLKAREGRLNALRTTAERAVAETANAWEFASNRGTLVLRRSQMIDNIFSFDKFFAEEASAA